MDGKALYSALPNVYGPLYLIPKAQKNKFEVMEGWKNYGEWVPKNDYHRIKNPFIDKKYVIFFTSIDDFL